ncbi:MAG: OmpA family protein [Bacteroidales bacterium]|nr:OmpA family protein [Bacteroidales bacterium]
MKYIRILAFIAFLPLSGWAQNVEFEKNNFSSEQYSSLREAKKNIKKGDNYFFSSIPGYQAALEYYLQAYSFNPSNAELNYKIGKSYLGSVQKVKSIPFLEKAASLNKEVGKTKEQPSDLQYLLARAYHLNYEFDRSITTYQTYMNSLSPAHLSEVQNDIQRAIKHCKTAQTMMANPVRVFIDNLGGPINSIYPEYSPIIDPEEKMLVFTSCRPSTTGGKKDPLDERYYEDILISHRLEDGRWGDPENPGKPFNSMFHDAAVGFSPNFKYVLIYKGDVKGGDIFICEISDGKWKKPRSIAKTINSGAHESSATFAPDMSALYFVSDRKGGFGGKDIYVSRITFKGKNNEKMEFSTPENLGAIINTPYDETGVFMQRNGRELYFSSTGHEGMGGYDIFKSELQNEQWSTPVNVGYPVNTPGDDVFFSISANGKHGYYSTWKPDGIGDRDIFMITFLGDEKPLLTAMQQEKPAFAIERSHMKTSLLPPVEMKGNALVLLEGTIRDKVTTTPLGVVVEIIDNESLQMIASFESNATTGKYMVSLPSGNSYGFSIRAAEYPFYSEILDIPPTNSYREINKDILLEKLTVGAKIILNNIFFDFNKSSLSEASIAELNRVVKMMNEVPSLKIEISGHTDHIGSEVYNQELSESRAHAVVNYLIASGIDRERLTYKGYGESQPIADNETEEGRKMNRRTEFEVIAL